MSIGPISGSGASAAAARLRALLEQRGEAAQQSGSLRPATTPTAGAPQGPSFGESLVDAIRQVNDLQLQADEMSRALAAGQAAELHQVMLAAEKANLSLQFTLQVRNKVIEAYQEIMRVQV